MEKERRFAGQLTVRICPIAVHAVLCDPEVAAREATVAGRVAVVRHIGRLAVQDALAVGAGTRLAEARECHAVLAVVLRRRLLNAGAVAAVGAGGAVAVARTRGLRVEVDAGMGVAPERNRSSQPGGSSG